MMKQIALFLFLLVFSFESFANVFPVGKMKKEKELVFADFFSPNGDGHNDTFVILNIEEYPINKLFVFSRYGESLYTSEPYNNDWDGTLNSKNAFFGDVLPEGIYYYRFEYIIGDFPVKKTGKIILKR